MSERFDQLTARHNALLERCELQRMHLARTTQDIERRLGRVDRGVAVVRRLTRNPVLVVGGVAVIALIGPRRLLRLASEALVFYPAVKRTIVALRSRHPAADDHP
jgi:hypothetical protein